MQNSTRYFLKIILLLVSTGLMVPPTKATITNIADPFVVGGCAFCAAVCGLVTWKITKDSYQKDLEHERNKNVATKEDKEARIQDLEEKLQASTQRNVQEECTYKNQQLEGERQRQITHDVRRLKKYYENFDDVIAHHAHTGTISHLRALQQLEDDYTLLNQKMSYVAPEQLEDVEQLASLMLNYKKRLKVEFGELIAQAQEQINKNKKQEELEKLAVAERIAEVEIIKQKERQQRAEADNALIASRKTQQELENTKLQQELLFKESQARINAQRAKKEKYNNINTDEIIRNLDNKLNGIKKEVIKSSDARQSEIVKFLTAIRDEQHKHKNTMANRFDSINKSLNTQAELLHKDNLRDEDFRQEVRVGLAKKIDHIRLYVESFAILWLASQSHSKPVSAQNLVMYVKKTLDNLARGNIAYRQDRDAFIEATAPEAE